MAYIKYSLLLFFVLFSTASMAERLPNGTYKQTSTSAGGDCGNCAVIVTKVTPSILQISGNNGWTGYAYYVQSKDSYAGAFEWKAGQGGAYENTVFLITLTYEGNTLTMDARSTRLNLSVTYRKQ